MSIRIAIVGPGRVGSALGQKWHRAGASLLGFVGRRPETVASALQFCGAGAALGVRDLATAHVVVFAVGDEALPAVVRQALAAPPRPCSLWLHTSGCHDLDVLAPAAGVARTGILHPALPFPDATAGLQALEGAPAVLSGGLRSLRLLQRLAELLGMRPLLAGPGDRRLYHAACALAANGSTALFALAERVLAAHGGLGEGDRRDLVAALMGAAVTGSGRRGPALALSGPVLRGDAATVARHLHGLRAIGDDALLGYRGLMLAALRLAEERGLPADAAERVRRALEGA